MFFSALLVSAVLLSFERLAYVWIARRPDAWLALCRRPRMVGLGEPVVLVRRLFIGFKILQFLVFAGWCMAFADGLLPRPTTEPGALVGGAALLVLGQVLNVSVFQRLGGTAVFFGGELGHGVRHVSGFPFSLMPHPQYVGAVLSIWGVFLIMRFPHPDWYALPLLETVFYALGARAESGGRRAACGRECESG